MDLMSHTQDLFQDLEDLALLGLEVHLALADHHLVLEVHQVVLPCMAQCMDLAHIL